MVLSCYVSYVADGFIAKWNPTPLMTWGLVSRGEGLLNIFRSVKTLSKAKSLSPDFDLD